MANLPEVDQYDAGVYQLETTDPALAGAGGIMNTPPKSLVNRTRFLLNRMLDGVLSFVLDSGAQNTITLALPQPVQALVDGMEVSFRVAVANNGAVTLSLTNTGGPVLPTLPVYGGDYAALAGGEFPAGATVDAKLNKSLNANNGGAWVVQSITGGFAKIPTAPVGDVTTKAANMAALAAATDGLAAINVGVGANVVLTAAQYGCAILKLTGTPTAPINLVLPAGQSGQWVINNLQGGSNNITVMPAGGAGVVLPQPASASGVATIVISDGTTATFASAQANTASVTPVTFSGITGNTLAIPGGFAPGAIAFIEKNGYLLEAPDFNAVSPNITLTKAAVSTDYFTVYRFSSFTVANAVLKTGDAMSGALSLAAGSTAPNPAANDNSQNLAPTAWIWGNIQALVNSIIGNVTGVTAAALDNSTKLSTTAWVWSNIQALVANCIAAVATAAGFSISATVNGYIKFPSWLGGLVIQWGYVPSAGAIGTSIITFPLTFPNNLYMATVSNAQANTPTIYISTGNWSASGIQVFTSNGSYTWAFSWIAIGR